MEKQKLPQNPPKETSEKKMTEKEAKSETVRLLETLLELGFVNVEKEDISDTHLKNLIDTLKKEEK